MGLLDFNFDDPAMRQGLLSAGAAMMEASGPSRMPVSFIQGLGRGLNQGMEGYRNAKKDDFDRQYEQMRLQQAQQEMMEYQQKLKAQQEQQAAMLAYAQSRKQAQMPQRQMQAPPSVQGYSAPNQMMQNDRVNGNFSGAQTGASMPAASIGGGEFYRAAQKHGLGTDNDTLNKIVGLVNQGGFSPDSAAATLSGKAPSQQQSMPQQNQQQPQQMTKGSLVQSQIAELMNQAQFYGSREDYQSQAMAQQLQKQAIELAKELPKYANDFRVAKDKNGNVVNLRLADDGTMMRSDYGVAEKMHFGDNGQQLLGIDQYTGKPMVISGKYQTPDSIASNATSMRGQNMTDSRARELNDITRQGQQTQVINDPNQGILLVDKGTGLTRKTYDQAGAPIPSESQAKKTSAANNIVPLIDEASKLISGATGSLIGAGYDATMKAFGGAPQGAQNTAKLKVIEGALMMNQPRMEGPQSDKDVALYRQMAGQLGDPTVPAPIKAAALNQIKALNEKYATGSKQSGEKTVVRTGKYGGRKVVQYSDGSVEYGN